MEETAQSCQCEEGASEKRLSFTAGVGDRSARLDRFLADKLGEHGLSREKIKELIRSGKVTVDDGPAKSPRQGLVPGSVARVIVPARASALRPEEGELSILYRDEELLVLDKPSGLVVHPAPGLAAGTLAHRLVARFPELAAQEGFRPGIVHRLDKDTSGLMLAALTEKCRLALSALFARHEVRKEYLALVRGVPARPEGIIDAPVGRHPTQKTKMAVTAGGKAAKSAWRVLYADPRGRFALVAVRIDSGRTHQIRVHMLHIGHPLWGDAVYGGRSSLPVAPANGGDAGACGGEIGVGIAPARQMLHAWKLGFIHPFPGAVARLDAVGPEARQETGTGGVHLSFCRPPPEDFVEAARFLSGETLRVAVTGAPGCGKSTLLEFWRGMGMPVFSADAEVRRLYQKGGDGQRLLRARFGDRFVPAPDGPVDKTALGAAMREDASLRREVESLVHPLVRHAARSFWLERERLGAAVAAAEIPLYLEADFAGIRSVDQDGRRTALPADASAAAHVLVGVRRPFALRRDSLMRERGWSEESVALMESWQWPEEKKLAACDLVLDNDGAEQDLVKLAGLAAAKLSAMRRERVDRVVARLEELWGKPLPSSRGLVPRA